MKPPVHACAHPGPQRGTTAGASAAPAGTNSGREQPAILALHMRASAAAQLPAGSPGSGATRFRTCLLHARQTKRKWGPPGLAVLASRLHASRMKTARRSAAQHSAAQRSAARAAQRRVLGWGEACWRRPLLALMAWAGMGRHRGCKLGGFASWEGLGCNRQGPLRAAWSEGRAVGWKRLGHGMRVVWTLNVLFIFFDNW